MNEYSNSCKSGSRKFKGIWIPRGLWESKAISFSEKCLLLEIDSYQLEETGYCHALNKHFAAHIGTSPKNISRMISNLESEGLIRVQQITDGGAFIERRLFVLKAPEDFLPLITSADTDFTGVFIPKEIWQNQGLTIIERAMLALIATLRDEVRGCFATNDFFAKKFGRSVNHVSEIISNLAAAGYVKVVQVRKQFITMERRIYLLTLDHLPAIENARDKRRPVRRTSEIGGYPQSHENLSTMSDEPLHKVMGTPPQCPERIYSFKEPKINPSIDTTPSASVCVKEEVNQEGRSMVKRQSGSEADSMIDYSGIKDLYNEILGEDLPACSSMTKTQKKNIFALTDLELPGKAKGVAATPAFFRTVFSTAAKSGFLLGASKSGWKANITFLTNPEKIEGVLTGAYDSKMAKPQKSMQYLHSSTRLNQSPEEIARIAMAKMEDY